MKAVEISVHARTEQSDQKIRKWIYGGLIFLVVGIPTSKFLLSISSIYLLVLFLWNAKSIPLGSTIRASSFLKVVVLLFAWQLISLLWTHELVEGLKEIKSKFPFYFLPILLACYPISPSERSGRRLLQIFVAVILCTAGINLAYHFFELEEGNIADIRDLSLFISHIRFAIMVSFSVGICLFLSVGARVKWRVVYLLFALFLSTYTIYSQVLSGVITLLALVAASLFYRLIISLNAKWRTFLVSFFILVFCGTIWVLVSLLKADTPDVDLGNLPLNTPSGNVYTHRYDLDDMENGHLMFIYLSEKELREEWNKVSSLDYDGTDKKGQPLDGTLIRYMTSKGLHKDAADFKSLTAQDIVFIENGISSIIQVEGGLRSRLNDLKYELNYSDEPNGSTLLQRFEYWKTGLRIWKQHPILGVGYGDFKAAYDQQYLDDHSTLALENRFLSHNQYLGMAVCLGLVGICLFLAIHYFFVKNAFSERNYLALIFAVVVLISYLVEDTLETQTGLAFVSFFLAILHKK